MIMSVIKYIGVKAQILKQSEKNYQKSLNLIVNCDSINSQTSLLK